MIDFHSHIVYDVDDGSNSIETSLKILKLAEVTGFHSIILTPHYMEDYYECPVNEINEKIEHLKELCKENDIDIQLYQANEIYIANDIVDLLKANKASTINKSKYVLFELPMNEEPPNLLEVIYNLKENDKVPIIAHPERYTYIQENPNRLLELIDMGVLFQSNYGSIIGQYGEKCKKTIKSLLKNNFIHFLGTDVHKSTSIYTKMEDIKKELEKILTQEQIKILVEENARKVLKNEKIEIDEPNYIKKSFFDKIFGN